jgi:hypothetical protein
METKKILYGIIIFIVLFFVGLVIYFATKKNSNISNFIILENGEKVEITKIPFQTDKKLKSFEFNPSKLESSNQDKYEIKATANYTCDKPPLIITVKKDMNGLVSGSEKDCIFKDLSIIEI